jgi:hypothetical protein
MEYKSLNTIGLGSIDEAIKKKYHHAEWSIMCGDQDCLGIHDFESQNTSCLV